MIFRGSRLRLLSGNDSGSGSVAQRLVVDQRKALYLQGFYAFRLAKSGNDK